MGNSPSKGNDGAPHSVNTGQPKDSTTSVRRPPRRRESLQVLPPSKPSVSQPSTSLEKVNVTPPSAPRAPPSRSSHSRKRSQSIATVPARKSQDVEDDKATRKSIEKANVESTTPRQSGSPVQSANVPIRTSAESINTLPIAASAPPTGNYYLPSQWARPPRLPLPIEKEVFQPGSPILTAADFQPTVLDPPNDDNDLQRTVSVLSFTNIDEDELGEWDYQFSANQGPRVNKLIEWTEGGDEVYVTGTFCGWDKKVRLYKNGPSKIPGAFSALIPFPVGMHHIAFLSGGELRSSKNLSTTVDFANVLVNWIEVSPSDHISKTSLPPTQPRDIPQAAKPDASQQVVPPGYHPPQVLPPVASESRPPPSGAGTPKPTVSSANKLSQSKHPMSPPKKTPTKEYWSSIPDFLLHLDAPEDSNEFQRASAVMSTQPAPPSLPMFLSKSILNGTTSFKDDSSVLIMPNHTVLNHLATSSIKNNVLATSCTTRYKKKCVTTIMYKPTKDTGG